ncbi:phage tail protein [Salisaeta longa]|uniref:phage tail protein n=1 Tax=Salisaeta longa TaxID=503170 RepID=UPI0003B2F0E6|nr:tail fiber protein [Salisaeta longa]
MSEPFVGEIRMFAGNFAPKGWALCDGQLLAVSQNNVLFSLIGTLYGGDGRTTFGLPDLRGRVPVHAGNGPGLTARRMGGKGGVEEVQLTSNQLPVHDHVPQASGDSGRQFTPVGNAPASFQGGLAAYGEAATYNFPPESMDSSALQAEGGGQPHTNMQPALCLNFIIALSGIYPSRS